MFARNILNESYLEARWIQENILEIRPCLPIAFENITFVKSDKCFHKIPIL
jgi:hypothetical protein